MCCTLHFANDSVLRIRDLSGLCRHGRAHIRRRAVDTWKWGGNNTSPTECGWN